MTLLPLASRLVSAPGEPCGNAVSMDLDAEPHSPAMTAEEHRMYIQERLEQEYLCTLHTLHEAEGTAAQPTPSRSKRSLSCLPSDAVHPKRSRPSAQKPLGPCNVWTSHFSASHAQAEPHSMEEL